MGVQIQQLEMPANLPPSSYSREKGKEGKKREGEEAAKNPPRDRTLTHS